ncbi:piggyBac transposable element-derived protein 4-like [Aphis craccivora]|uniref:PiggyBac transposable element-derived protein 4-like n=1 Tax=Aphis craccivora TaxID=307492 RepID=A0A6G0ZJ26_APHCR|nr:piggyBac transposable element-derived protein 4-like [Aphis craccivora]
MFSSDDTSEKTKIPPIFILNHNLDFNLLWKTLVDIVGKMDFSANLLKKTSKCKPTLSLRQLPNLLPSTSCDDIKSALKNCSLSVLQVVNVLQRQTKIPLPLFFVDLVKDDNSKTIFDITSILHTKIKVEEPHKRRDLVQCQNCQHYGHTRSYCNHFPRYVRCGKNHLSSLCDKPNDVPPTCALCQGKHPANYTGCQIHKQPQKNQPAGLVLKFAVYTGVFDDMGGQGHASKVVLHLMSEKLENGHSLYMDNFYNSFDLATSLIQKNTYCTGTLRLNRKNTPVEKIMGPNEHVRVRAQNFIVLLLFSSSFK